MGLPSGRARVAGLALATVTCLGATVVGAAPPDRLDRFRHLAATRLSLAQVIDVDGPSVYREGYALVDEEIVESLASGSLFASTEFLQDRLDAFAESWGAASLRLTRLGRLVVGAFTLGDRAGGHSVRVYGPLHGEPALLATLDRDGLPSVYALPAEAGGGVRFVVAWAGPTSGRGTRALRLDLVRQERDGVRVAWSSVDMFPEGLFARTYAVSAAEIRVRYEMHYPGWAPGCDAQTEGEDVYRLAAGAPAFVRTQHRLYNAWHRELRAAAAALFDALDAGDPRALAGLVPDVRLRSRLPATLRAEPACDSFDGPGPDAASVAASTADQRPWSLTFRRAGARWRLTSAAPLLQ